MPRHRKLERKKSQLIARIIKITIGLLLIFITFDIFLVFNSGILNIKTISVQLVNINCANESQIKSESALLNQSILSLNEVLVQQKLQSKFLCIKSVAINKKLPNSISLLVYGRQAMAELVSIQGIESTESAVLSSEILATKSGEIASSSGFAVDSEGVIFAKDISLNVPKIFFYGKNLNLGRNLDQGTIGNALKILDGLKTFGLDIKDAKIYSQNILVIESINPPKLIFSLNDDLNLQLASLQLILTQAKISNSQMEFVDLRYDKPVVKYAKN